MAPNAVIIGDVTIGDGSSVWYGAVIRGDEGRIIIGRNSNIQDNAVLHVVPDYPTVVADEVTIGHGALLEGCTIETGAVVGMGAVVLEGAIVGASSLIAAGSVVQPRTAIPSNSMAAGAPAVVKKVIAGAAQQVVETSAAVYRTLSRAYIEQRVNESADISRNLKAD